MGVRSRETTKPRAIFMTFFRVFVFLTISVRLSVRPSNTGIVSKGMSISSHVPFDEGRHSSFLSTITNFQRRRR